MILCSPTFALEHQKLLHVTIIFMLLGATSYVGAVTKIYRTSNGSQTGQGSWGESGHRLRFPVRLDYIVRTCCCRKHVTSSCTPPHLQPPICGPRTSDGYGVEISVVLFVGGTRVCWILCCWVHFVLALSCFDCGSHFYLVVHSTPHQGGFRGSGERGGVQQAWHRMYVHFLGRRYVHHGVRHVSAVLSAGQAAYLRLRQA